MQQSSARGYSTPIRMHITFLVVVISQQRMLQWALGHKFWYSPGTNTWSHTVQQRLLVLHASDSESMRTCISSSHVYRVAPANPTSICFVEV